jgi:hypothetical protein
MQATFTVGRRTLSTPRLQAGQNWQQRTGNFNSSDIIPVSVEAYCYRNGQNAGYVRADLQVSVFIPSGSVGVWSPSKDWCDSTKHGWIEAIEPVPCLGASDQVTPAPIISVVDTEDISADVCDAGLRTTVSVREHSLTSPLLTTGERWIESFGKLERYEAYPVTIEAYCYREGQAPGYTKVSSVLTWGGAGVITIYILEPSTTNRSCISAREGFIEIEIAEPAPCVSYVPPKR